MCTDPEALAQALFAERVALDHWLVDVRRRVALRALANFDGNRSRAAQALGMDRKTFARVVDAPPPSRPRGRQ